MMDDSQIHGLRAQPKAKARPLATPSQRIIDGFANATDTLDVGGKGAPKGKGKYTRRRARYAYPNPSWTIDQPADTDAAKATPQKPQWSSPMGKPNWGQISTTQQMREMILAQSVSRILSRAK